MVDMEILLGLATIYLLSVAFKVARDDYHFYQEFYSDSLTNQDESV